MAKPVDPKYVKILKLIFSKKQIIWGESNL